MNLSKKEKILMGNINVLVYNILLVQLVCSINLMGQEERDVHLSYGFKSYTNFSSVNAQLPFWFHQQQFGVIDQKSANAVLYGTASKTWHKGQHFKLRAEGEVIGRVSEESTMYLNTGFLEARFKGFKLTGGRFIDPLALKEDELSTGSFIMSRNATPIPRIAFQTDDFITIPGANGIVNYKAYLGHGWFEDGRYTKDVLLHQKYFYLNIKYAFFDAVGGIVHHVQWAGSNEQFGNLPSGWKTFLDVFFASGSSNPDAPGGERSNATGNSIAAYDFSLGLDFRGVDLRAYRLFYLEDKVSTRFRSPWDGIWGLSVRPDRGSLIGSVLYEHINTKRQDSFDFEPRGTASYYNNFVYRTGWTYEGRVIGNSLLLTDGTKDMPVYNNIVIAHHVGIKGVLSDFLDYTLKYTFSRNYGVWQDQVIRYIEPGRTVRAELRPLEELKKRNQSILLQFSYTLPQHQNIEVDLALSGDFGELYGNRMGGGLNFRYTLY